MKSYTRKQMLEAKAKLKTARQEVNRMRKSKKVMVEMHEEEILRYRIDLITARKHLNNTQNKLQKTLIKKWYQFQEVK